MNQNPVTSLAAQWKIMDRPRSWELVSKHRAELLSAAALQIQSKSEQSIPYDPFHCPIFRWCSQWLDVAEGKRKKIEPEVEFYFRLIMDPAPLSKKLLSANDYDTAV